MYIDSELLFTPTALSPTTAGDYKGTNVLDLWFGRSAVDSSAEIGPGEVVKVLFTVTVAFDAGGTSVAFKLVTDDNTSLSSPTTVVQSQAYTDPALGFQVQLAVPIEDLLATGERYLGAMVTSVGTYSAGSVEAAIVVDAQTNKNTYAAVTGR